MKGVRRCCLSEAFKLWTRRISAETASPLPELGPWQKLDRHSFPLPWPRAYDSSYNAEADEGIWLVSFMSYDLGLIDPEQKTLQSLDNQFGPRLSPMS
jgi:hypothetical protein